MQRRIAKGLCQNCGQHLPAGSSACPFCGFAQYQPCGHCKKPTHVYGKFCKECGQSVG
ncbi:MAG TPA: zinc ribbon domain-containing protein [Candidatus Binatia bacterium]